MRKANAGVRRSWPDRSFLMGWGAIASAVLPALVGAASSAFGASRQNKANRAISQKQMDFQREMSSTSYQRSMTDMRAAGLNPILAYKQGGASTPAGAGIPAQNVLEPAVSTALQTRRLTADLKNIEANIGKTHADTDASRAAASLNTQLMLKAGFDATSAASSAKINKVKSRVVEEYLKTPAGKATILANEIGTSINPLINSARGLGTISR